MAIAELTNLEKAYAGKTVLRNLSLALQPGQKIGLVGPNGSGKTTLLKILAGAENPDTGSAAIAKSVTWAYVPQVPNLDPNETLRHQVALAFDELHQLEQQIHAAADLLAHTSGAEHDKALDRYGQLEHHFQAMGGYDIQRRVEAVLDTLGFAASDLDLPIHALSGGQKSRAQIARLLLQAPDLMLLDEPTNHLDLAMLNWLENTLNAPELAHATLLVVSHDRYFLDSVVDEIFELRDGQIDQYPGNYSAYVTLRDQRRLAAQRAFDQQQSYIAKQEEFIRRFQANQRARQARGRRTRLERLKQSAFSQPTPDGRTVSLNLKVAKPTGHEVLHAEGLSKSFPAPPSPSKTGHDSAGEERANSEFSIQNSAFKTLFTNLSFTIQRGTRLGIIGPNGSGKTTLLNVLAGNLPPTAGKFKWGHNVALQFYRQEHEDLRPSYSVFDELQSVRITATHQELRDLAALFLFSGDTVTKKTAVLSGGEKARVSLAKLLLNPANTILMDEPTNHLDMPTAEILENALDSYDGTLILVSHDRYFLDQICDTLLVLDGQDNAGGWRLFQGSYTDYLAARAREQQAALDARRETERLEKEKNKEKERQTQARTTAAKSAKPKLPYKFARLSIADIETQIINLETEIANLETRFGDPKLAANPVELQNLQKTYDEKKLALAELNSVWETKIDSE